MKSKSSNAVLITCFLAALLEMYDFAIFGFLMPVIHKNYLSFLDKQTATLIGYAFFAVGFVVRPLGSLLFGYIGDTSGRKKALILSVSFMGLASLSLSLLPPYASIGIISCYIIVLVRIVQGISLGGEFSGVIIYAVEHFESKKAGLVGGIVITGCISGVFLATMVGKIVQSPSAYEDSWRFAFLLGFGLSAVGYFVRKKLLETPEFLEISKSKAKVPIIEGIKSHYKECIGTIGVAAANGINFYFILVFLPSYVNKLAGSSIDYFPIITTLVLVFISPIFSYLSDYTGRSKMLGWGLVGTAIWGYFGLQIVATTPSLESSILFFLVHAVIYSMQAGTSNVFIVEVFPVKYRFSCAALCYSLGMGVIGGTSPMIATLIVNNYPSEATNFLSYYMFIIPGLGYLGMKLAQKQCSSRLQGIVKKQLN